MSIEEAEEAVLEACFLRYPSLLMNFARISKTKQKSPGSSRWANLSAERITSPMSSNLLKQDAPEKVVVVVPPPPSD